MSDYNYFELAKALARAQVNDIEEPVSPVAPAAEECPMLAPAEHAWIEKMVGRALTNEEAQAELRNATMEAAIAFWEKGRDDA